MTPYRPFQLSINDEADKEKRKITYRVPSDQPQRPSSNSQKRATATHP